MAEIDPNVASIIAHMLPVRTAVREAGREGAARARANLAPHNKSGRTEIKVSYDRVDTLVSMENPRGEAAVMSIEFGWTRGSTHVDGLHILGRAFGL